MKKAELEKMKKECKKRYGCGMTSGEPCKYSNKCAVWRNGKRKG